MIHLTLDQHTVAAGHSLSGTLIYQQTSSRQHAPDRTTLELRWYTEGRGTCDRQTIHSLTLNPEKLATGVPIPFTLKIPDEGPITYNGSLLRIIWEVQAKANYPGLLSGKDKLVQPFTVICR
jgi:hypothetical protein